MIAPSSHVPTSDSERRLRREALRGAITISPITDKRVDLVIPSQAVLELLLQTIRLLTQDGLRIDHDPLDLVALLLVRIVGGHVDLGEFVGLAGG